MRLSLTWTSFCPYSAARVIVELVPRLHTFQRVCPKLFKMWVLVVLHQSHQSHQSQISCDWCGWLYLALFNEIYSSHELAKNMRALRTAKKISVEGRKPAGKMYAVMPSIMIIFYPLKILSDVAVQWWSMSLTLWLTLIQTYWPLTSSEENWTYEVWMTSLQLEQ